MVSFYFVHAQWHDNIWRTPLFVPIDNKIISTKYDFNFSPTKITKEELPLSYQTLGVSQQLSNNLGIPMFYTNGRRLIHDSNEIFHLGDSLLSFPIQNLISPYSVLTLPIFGGNSYWSISLNNYTPGGQLDRQDLELLRVDSVINGEEGTIKYRDRKLLNQKFLSYMDATKHANGRDWWIVIPEGKDTLRNQIDYLVFLAEPDTVKLIHRIPTDKWIYGDSLFHSEIAFSPNGNFLCGSDRFDGFFVWDFDRCTGMISNFRFDEYLKPQAVVWGGVVISPNSQFAYVPQGEELWQYDLFSNNLGSSKTIFVRDKFRSPAYISPNQSVLSLSFDSGELCPNGEIIMFQGQALWQDVISFPNQKGITCEVRQHDIYTPTGGTAYPNYPNYRLGPIDGSSCDTLELDNHPLADFRWDYTQEVTGDPLWAQFTDNSFYEPATWHWDFGDGSSSTDTCPVHSFPAPGIYTVCMTVCNQNSCDTICKDVEVGQVNDDLVADYNYFLWDYIVHDTFRGEFFGENYPYPVTYSWDFGDGNTAMGQIQDHTYNLPGFYEVCLIVCNNFMCDTLCKEVQIGGSNALMLARFSVLSSDTTTVTFRDQSIVNPTSWVWDFGDGAMSMEQHPTHTFSAAGVYSVCLTACNAFGLCDTICKDITVDAPNITFTAHFGFTISNTSGQVHFVDQSFHNPITWTWNFGDGNTSTEQSPSHQYMMIGDYVACLVSCNALLCDSFCLDVPIVTTHTDALAVQRDRFMLHPNPVQDMLHISTTHSHRGLGDLVFVLQDVAGRIIFSEKMQGSASEWHFSIKNVELGLYFYEMKRTNGQVVQVGKVLRM